MTSARRILTVNGGSSSIRLALFATGPNPVRLLDGRPHPASQVVLRALLGRDGTVRIRWKLSRADKWPAVGPATEKAAAEQTSPAKKTSARKAR